MLMDVAVIARAQSAVAAENIANADTPTYQARAATLAAQASGGVAVTRVGVPSGPGHCRSRAR